jgi:hypothetical protein
MTPKEKAEELFNKMYNTDDPMGNYPMCFDTAKQCALIAVDEIINSIVITDLTTAENQFIYWEEVKQEIEKL